MKRLVLAIAAAFAVSTGINAATTLADARTLIDDGDYESALAALTELAKKDSRNTTIPVLIGDCYRYMGRDAEATEQYKKAIAKGNNDGRLGLVEIAIREYRVNDADRLLEDYRKNLKKGRKTAPDESETVTAQLERTRNMLNRVESIVVIDSINVPADDFFTYYRLSRESGSLNSPSILPPAFEAAPGTVVFEPESKAEMIWSAPDEDNNYHLVGSVALYGNEWDAPEALGDHLGEGGDANYPFMMSDGITLYYANDGDNTLGGYDIFITRRDANGFLQPQNLGMPYNSPYNDYMLALDETTGVGWWASDRNRIEGQVTIYLFIPRDMRVNIDVNDPTLIDRARLTSIAATHEEDADYNEILKKVSSISRGGSHSLREQCYFPLPDGRIITRIEQLKKSDARIALRNYLDLKNCMDSDSSRLAKLRKQYNRGDKSVADEILTLEQRALDDAVTELHAANAVIEAEFATD